MDFDNHVFKLKTLQGALQRLIDGDGDSTVAEELQKANTCVDAVKKTLKAWDATERLA